MDDNKCEIQHDSLVIDQGKVYQSSHCACWIICSITEELLFENNNINSYIVWSCSFYPHVGLEFILFLAYLDSVIYMQTTKKLKQISADKIFKEYLHLKIKVWYKSLKPTEGNLVDTLLCISRFLAWAERNVMIICAFLGRSKYTCTFSVFVVVVYLDLYKLNLHDFHLSRCHNLAPEVNHILRAGLFFFIMLCKLEVWFIYKSVYLFNIKGMLMLLLGVHRYGSCKSTFKKLTSPPPPFMLLSFSFAIHANILVHSRHNQNISLDTIFQNHEYSRMHLRKWFNLSKNICNGNWTAIHFWDSNPKHFPSINLL